MFFLKKELTWGSNNVRRHLSPFVLADSAINVAAEAVTGDSSTEEGETSFVVGNDTQTGQADHVVY